MAVRVAMEYQSAMFLDVRESQLLLVRWSLVSGQMVSGQMVRWKLASSGMEPNSFDAMSQITY